MYKLLFSSEIYQQQFSIDRATLKGNIRSKEISNDQRIRGHNALRSLTRENTESQINSAIKVCKDSTSSMDSTTFMFSRSQRKKCVKQIDSDDYNRGDSKWTHNYNECLREQCEEAGNKKGYKGFLTTTNKIGRINFCILTTNNNKECIQNFLCSAFDDPKQNRFYPSYSCPNIVPLGDQTSSHPEPLPLDHVHFGGNKTLPDSIVNQQDPITGNQELSDNKGNQHSNGDICPSQTPYVNTQHHSAIGERYNNNTCLDRDACINIPGMIINENDASCITAAKCVVSLGKVILDGETCIDRDICLNIPGKLIDVSQGVHFYSEDENNCIDVTECHNKGKTVNGDFCEH